MAGTCFASAKEDLVIAIDKTYDVAGKSYRLPENIRVDGINFLRTHYFTEEQCLEILKYIDEAVTFAQKVGTTDISKFSDEDLEHAVSIVSKAAKVAKSAPRVEEKKQMIEEEKIKENENLIKPQELIVSSKNENIIMSNEENDESVENKTEILDFNNENNFIDDEIDYSKYLDNEQFNDDISFEKLKEDVQGKIISKIFLIVVVFLIIVIILIIVIRHAIKKTKGETQNEKN